MPPSHASRLSSVAIENGKYISKCISPLSPGKCLLICFVGKKLRTDFQLELKGLPRFCDVSLISERLQESETPALSTEMSYRFSCFWMSSEIYLGHLVRAGQSWRGPRRIYPRGRRIVRNVTVYLARNVPICRQLQPYRLHFRNFESKQITHLQDNCYTIYLSTNLLERNQKTLSTKLYSLWEPNLPYHIKIAHFFTGSIRSVLAI